MCWIEMNWAFYYMCQCKWDNTHVAKNNWSLNKKHNCYISVLLLLHLYKKIIIGAMPISINSRFHAECLYTCSVDHNEFLIVSVQYYISSNIFSSYRIDRFRHLFTWTRQVKAYHSEHWSLKLYAMEIQFDVYFESNLCKE